jgi:DHHC palmitoyltransferase
MSALVWLLMLYSAATVTLLTITEGIPVVLGMTYNFLCFMALACHAKTSLTDPGSVPVAAIPSERQRLMKDSHSMCGQCQTFKPPMSHHCRICNRCISRMDHHCPWMNNCVGANNLSKSSTRKYHAMLDIFCFLIFALYRTFSLVFGVHLDVCSVFAESFRLELLLLRGRRLYLPPYRCAPCSHNDRPLCWCLFVHFQYVNECVLRSHDRYWNYRSAQEKGYEYNVAVRRRTDSTEGCLWHTGVVHLAVPCGSDF